jgi:hypothetical protein
MSGSPIVSLIWIWVASLNIWGRFFHWHVGLNSMRCSVIWITTPASYAWQTRVPEGDKTPSPTKTELDPVLVIVVRWILLDKTNTKIYFVSAFFKHRALMVNIYSKILIDKRKLNIILLMNKKCQWFVVVLLQMVDLLRA